MDRTLINSITRATRCPGCNARIGTHCADKFGVPVNPPHPSRQRLAAARFPQLGEAIAAAAQETTLRAAAEAAGAHARKEEHLVQSGRTAAGQFAPGASGNPAGRPSKDVKARRLQEKLSAALASLAGAAGGQGPAKPVRRADGADSHV